MDERDPANAVVIPLAIAFLSVAALFQIVDGAQAVGAGMLRGLGDTAVPMTYAIFGYWVVAIGVGLSLAFWADMGGVGIWVGLASGLAVVSVLMIARWMRRERLGLTGSDANPLSPQAFPLHRAVAKADTARNRSRTPP